MAGVKKTRISMISSGLVIVMLHDLGSPTMMTGDHKVRVGGRKCMHVSGAAIGVRRGRRAIMPERLEETAREAGWEECSDGWRRVFSPYEVRLLMFPDYRLTTWKEARVRDALSAVLVTAGAIELGMYDLLVPQADWL
jgi:hypothetical protein